MKNSSIKPNKKILKTVVFIVTQPFPIGLASTNRIISLAQGMSLQEVRVKVFCIKSINPEKVSIPPGMSEIGVFNGIEYQYTTDLIDESSLIAKAKLFIRGIINGFLEVLKYSKHHKIDQIWISFSEIHFILYAFSLKILTKSKLTLYRSESTELERNKVNQCLYDNVYSYFIIKLIDNFVIMTNDLKKYFDARKKKQANSILIPTSIEPERFFAARKLTDQESYIAYAGSFDFKKDGIDILLEAFSIIASRHPNIKLYLIGKSNNPNDDITIRKLIDDLVISDKVYLPGLVSRDEIPAILINAKVLALARPESKQNSLGFPSKLGEYLITGNPVVVTNVGEVSKYLVDRVSAYLANPGDSIDFADKLEDVLTNIEEATKVGQNGRNIALRFFDYKLQGKKIYDSLLSVNHV